MSNGSATAAMTIVFVLNDTVRAEGDKSLSVCAATPIAVPDYDDAFLAVQIAIRNAKKEFDLVRNKAIEALNKSDSTAGTDSSGQVPRPFQATYHFEPQMLGPGSVIVVICNQGSSRLEQLIRQQLQPESESSIAQLARDMNMSGEADETTVPVLVPRRDIHSDQAWQADVQ